MTISVDYLTLPAADLPNSSPISVEVLADKTSLFRHFARAIADEIKTNNTAGRPTRLILPVGPVGQYPVLVEICNREKISWRSTFTFNMDEYCDWQGRPLPIDHPLSFQGYMRRVLFDRLEPDLSLPPGQAHFPDPLDLDRISAEIQTVGGIDTCYGGVGYHGHVAFNEPPSSRWRQVSVEEFKASLTRIVPLASDTIVMNSIRNTGGDPSRFPPMGVTLGMGDILGSRRIRVYYAGGMWQRHMARVALFGPESVDYPVTLLRSHPDYRVILDDDTAQPVTMSL